MLYKIAIGTSDGEHIDLHFGEIKTIFIYEVDEDTGNFSLAEKRVIEFPKDQEFQPKESGCACGKFLTEKISAVISDCTYFLVAKIGNRPHRILQENNINCIEAPDSIKESIEKLNRYFTSHKKREVHIF